MSNRSSSRAKWGSQRDYEQTILTGATCGPCGGKIDYLDKRSAKLVIRRMKGRSGRLNVYRCPERAEGVIPAWHIGHPPKVLTDGKVDRTELRPSAKKQGPRGGPR